MSPSVPVVSPISVISGRWAALFVGTAARSDLLALVKTLAETLNALLNVRHNVSHSGQVGVAQVAGQFVEQRLKLGLIIMDQRRNVAFVQADAREAALTIERR